MPSTSAVHQSLTALPVYNEVEHVREVLEQVSRYSSRILVVDDGSTDGTADVLREMLDVQVVRHKENRGYGAALVSAFGYAQDHGYQTLVTIDCDGQHEPQLIPRFVEAINRGDADIISGSRYLQLPPADATAPEDRRRINRIITAELNDLLDLRLTDAFCGFKAYRVSSLAELDLVEPGYAMPLELWIKALAAGQRVLELPVPLVYLEEKRSFGGALDDADSRLCYYRTVIRKALQEVSPHLDEASAFDRSCHTLCGDSYE
ncbi:MAG: glycosyltransferase family 2 protein [Pirellulales bacterium]|nr:glycosyltransferase family 2 protein [Pirellulales bacterium]